jgi:hypothetical protein
MIYDCRSLRLVADRGAAVAAFRPLPQLDLGLNWELLD